MLQEKKLRVLVVEDEGIIAQDIALMLEQLGYEVAGHAGTADEALELAGTVATDLVLMDIKLRGPRDGVQTAGEIREQFGVPVVFLTSHADSETLSRAKRTQPYGYVVKPFAEADLRVAIEVGFSRHQLQEELEEKRGWFEAALESTSDAVIATDADGQIVFVNSVAEGLTGWLSEEAKGRSFDEIVRIKDARGQTGSFSLDRLFEENETVALQHAFLHHRDGKKRAVAGSLEPMRRSGSAVLYGAVIHLEPARP